MFCFALRCVASHYAMYRIVSYHLPECNRLVARPHRYGNRNHVEGFVVDHFSVGFGMRSVPGVEMLSQEPAVVVRNCVVEFFEIVVHQGLLRRIHAAVSSASSLRCGGSVVVDAGAAFHEFSKQLVSRGVAVRQEGSIDRKHNVILLKGYFFVVALVIMFLYSLVVVVIVFLFSVIVVDAIFLFSIVVVVVALVFNFLCFRVDPFLADNTVHLGTTTTTTTAVDASRDLFLAGVVE
mmetsp:Transcript_23117/g.50481  ORF Transcript_23117/g.50481 Transcript_23117/m.50481 type:complete len:236 (+) Transcript_23117:408-1115(+)